MNIAKMLKQAQQMQQQMQAAQAELQKKVVEASVGGGKVTARANGAGDVLSIKIAPEVVALNDAEMIEDLVLAAVQQAIEQGKAAASDEMGRITGGLGLPPGLGF